MNDTVNAFPSLYFKYLFLLTFHINFLCLDIFRFIFRFSISVRSRIEIISIDKVKRCVSKKNYIAFGKINHTRVNNPAKLIISNEIE